MELGKKIAHLRTQKGISQEKLAEMLDVTRQAVTKWENGKSNPDTENLIRIAEIFGCSLDELCGIETESKKQEPKIHIGGHILAAVSVLIFIGYCVIGGISGNFSGDILILLLIIAFPMHVFLHLVFWGMVKSGEFSFLAGYDPDIKYNIDGMRRYIAGLDFMLGFETASYLFLMAASSLIVPEFEIAYILLIGYIISFIAGIFFIGYKFGDRIYENPEDAKRAKRGFPASVILLVVILLSVGAFMLVFELKGFENNSAKSFPLLGMMFVSIGFALGGYLAESKRLKKEEDPRPFFGKAFIICNILAVAAMAAMALL
ncbi:MAG: helix-turn-helix transcriptional regulator [Oscillospiraceae bacterium]|nr:helix-turn-helix transcriptional regulator [Oscillospiraceae bacterium]